MSKRSVFLVALLALLALLAGACSSPSEETVEADGANVDGGGAAAMDEAMNAAPGELAFAEILTQTATASSARFEGNYTITGVDPADPTSVATLTMEGSFDDSTESMEMTIDLGDYFASGLAGGESLIPPGFEEYLTDPMRLVVIGAEGWINWSLLSLFTGQDDVWLALEANELGSTTENFGFASGASDPTEILEGLAAAHADVEDLGSETVRGEQTQHWRALVDLASLSADLDPVQQAALEDKVGPLTATQFPMDLWVGADDGLIRRYAIEMSSEAFAADAPDTVGSVEVVVELYDYGTDVGITAPPPDQVVSGSNLLMP